MINILVIPDSHVKPDVSSERMTWLGNLIVSRKPDVVLCLGDFNDCESLSSFDVGKKSFEGRRLKKDIEAGIKAQELLFKPLDQFNLDASINHKKRYKPRFVMCLGNHENRINRAVNDDPKLEGTISIHDLEYASFGWEIYDFKEVVNIAGINFVHYFPNGLMDKAISGATIGRSILQKTFNSGIQGHSHILNTHTEVTVSGKRMWGISAGCFLDENQVETYVSPTVQSSWWRGVLYLHNASTGDFDLETISLERLKREYQ